MTEKKKSFDVAQFTASIRKRTTPSACIDRFCELMEEVDDDRLKAIIIADFNRFIEELKHLFAAVDQVTEMRFKARMLQDSFINAQKFFKRTEFAYTEFRGVHYAERDGDGLQIFDSEQTRKVFLMFDYYPAIVKALIQTKRRAVGLDSNSKHFSREESEAVYKN